MASAVATPLEKQFSTIAGIDSMTLDQRARRHADHAAVHRSTATSMPPRRTCRRRSPTPRAQLAAEHADAAFVSEGESRRPAGPVHRADLARRCRCPTVDEYADTLMAQRISMVSGVAQVQVFGAQKYAVRVQLDPARAGDARHRHRRSRQRRRRAQRRTCPPERCLGPLQRLHGAGDRAAQQRGRLPAADRRLSQRHAGAAGRTRPRVRQRGERQDRRLVQRRSARWCWRSSASPAPTRSRSCDASSELLPHVPRADAGVGQRWTSSVRPLGVDPRIGRRRKVHAAADASRWWCW